MSVARYRFPLCMQAAQRSRAGAVCACGIQQAYSCGGRIAGGRMASPDKPPGLLSMYRAFVVQLDTYTDITRGQRAGQVEYVVSGQASPFHSLDALLTFMRLECSPIR